MESSFGRNLGIAAVVIVAYVVSARFELLLIHSRTSMGVIWLPAGISMAAILLGGRRIVPVIFLASLCVELLSAQPLLSALSMAAGNAGEALLGGYLVNRLPEEPTPFRDPRMFCAFPFWPALWRHLSVRSSEPAPLRGALLGPARPEILTIFAAWWAGHALVCWSSHLS